MADPVAPPQGSNEINQQNSSLGGMPFGIGPPFSPIDIGGAYPGGLDPMFAQMLLGVQDYNKNNPDTQIQAGPGLFNWADRGRDFENAEREVYSNGPNRAAGLQYINTHERPRFANLGDATLPSTDNWQLLPAPYRSPEFAMVNGRIINKALANNPRRYLELNGIVGDPGQYKMSPGFGIGLPMSLNDNSIGGQAGFWPGDVRGRTSIVPLSWGTT